MASSPREVAEILSSFQQTFEDIDPTIDLTKGPMSVFVYSASEEISRVEAQAAYLQTVYRLDTADDLEDDDIDGLGLNYGIDPDVGDVAAVVVTLYRQSRPVDGEAYVASEGDLVGSEDGRFVFALVSDVSMNGDTPDIYFNSDEARYEVNVRAEAVSVGEDFNLPAETIDSFLTDISDFDGVTNYNPARGGNDPLDKVQFRNLLWDTIQGLNADIIGTLVTTVENTDPTGFQAIATVPSTELETFERLQALNGKMGYDLYTITDETVEFLDQLTAEGGETSLVMERQPVNTVEYISVDGERVPFSFDADERQTVRRSPRAEDSASLATALEPGQIVEIKYWYYENVFEAYDAFQGRSSPFGSDVLVRLAYAIQVFIAAEIDVLSADDRDSVVNDIQDFTEAFLNNPVDPSNTRRIFPSELDPAEYQDAVLREVAGLSKFTLLNFNRVDTAVSDIERIQLNGKTEYPVLAPTFVVI